MKFLKKGVAYTTPIIFKIQYPNPSTQLLNIPYNITGPAILKIWHPIPKTCPSFLNSIADAQTPFAKPVIGTSAPAPPQFASDG